VRRVHLDVLSQSFHRSLQPASTHTPVQIGAIKYISPLPGFRGLIKERYNDFLVYECEPDGHVVHLTTIAADAPTAAPAGPSEPGAAEAQEDPTLKQARADLLALIGEETLATVDALNKSGGEPVRLPPNDDKSTRSAIHRAISTLYKHLVSSTVKNADSGQNELVVKYEKDGRQRQAQAARHTPKYTKFVLLKSNKDTMSAVAVIASMTRAHVSRFAYAGTKDRRAVTTQWVTASNMAPAQLAGLNKRLIGMRCG
jgi:tRNA pseudouridine13 synthase